MPRNIFLSFRPEFFRPILYDIKKYEYRKRFLKEEATAYLYLSYPVQEVIGIMNLGKAIMTEQIINNYKNEPLIYDRLSKNLDGGEKYIIPIISLTLFEKPIKKEELETNDKRFKVPHCYFNLENYPKTFDFLKSQKTLSTEFINDHSNIFDDNLGMTCAKMELTPEFQEKDKKYTNDNKYIHVKSGYINKER